MKKKEYKTPIAKCTRTKYESVMGGISNVNVETPFSDNEYNIGETEGSDDDNVAKKHTLIDVWDDADDGDDDL